jgi:CheY-like chemotaxis protein
MGKLILVVDDEEDIVYIIRTVLSKKGYSVREAYSGEECLEILKKEKPDLIFMDIMMPGIDGWETSRKIKTHPKTKDIPISMLSIKCDRKDKKRSIDYALAEEHLCKPVNFERLLKTAEILLTRNN